MSVNLTVTAFEAFFGEAINPSALILAQLQRQESVAAHLLPVSYLRAGEKISSILDQGHSQALVMLGQAGGRRQVCLEKFAINIENHIRPDEDGVFRTDQVIEINGPAAFMSSLPLRQWIEKAKDQKLPIEISYSAGEFICNSIYYRAFSEIQRRGLNIPLLFVHVPYLPEQVQDKVGVASLELETSLACVRFVIQEIEDLVQSRRRN